MLYDHLSQFTKNNLLIFYLRKSNYLICLFTMEQLSAYEQALLAETNPAHVRLFLFICSRLREKDVDCHDMAQKSDPFAAGLLGMINENTTGYNREETSILFDHLMKWYETPYTDYGGKTKLRGDIRFSVDYGPDQDFAKILQSTSAAIKEKRGPNGPKLPRSWGVGMKCCYSSSKGHAQFEYSTIDHHGQLMKIEPWEKFFQSEDPADEAIALSLQPEIPWPMKNKFFYRELARKCQLTSQNAPLFFAVDDYELGKYLYESEENVSSELKYLAFRADSLSKDYNLASDIIRGPRGWSSVRSELLVALPQQQEFSHSAANIDTYCPLLGLIIKDNWYADPGVKFILAAEQRQAFTLGFAEAAAIALSRNDRAMHLIIDVMNDILIEGEKAAFIQLLVKQLQLAPQTDHVEKVIHTFQPNKRTKVLLPPAWDLPLREIDFSKPSRHEIDARFLSLSHAKHAEICQVMNFTIADAEKLMDHGAWGFVKHLFSISKSTDLEMVDRVWLRAIDNHREELAMMIYDAGYPLFHETTTTMQYDGYGENRNPFTNLLRNFPRSVLESSRTDVTLCPPETEDYIGSRKRAMFRRGVVDALVKLLDNRSLLEDLQVNKDLLEKFFPGDIVIKKEFFLEASHKLSDWWNHEEFMKVLHNEWPWQLTVEFI